MNLLDRLLAASVLLLAIWLALLLWKTRMHWRFPFFFIYVLSIVVIEGTRFCVIGQYRTLFFVFWISEAIYAVLGVLALFEVFRKVFFGFYMGFAWFRALFPATALLALAIAIWAAYRNPIAGASRIIIIVLFFGLAVNFMRLCLFGLFGVVAAAFRLKRWRFAQLGIILGFGIAALGSTAAFWARSEFGTKLQTFAKYAPPVAYILAIVVWLLTFLYPEPEPKWVSAANIRQLTEEIREDTAALKRFLDKNK